MSASESEVKIRIEGAVDTETVLAFDDLAALPGQVDDIGALIPGREGGAVRLASILAQVGIGNAARFITVTADDGEFAACVPLVDVADAVVAYRLGSAPLPRAKGGPARFFIPNAAACESTAVDACANVKFLATLTLSSEAGTDTRPSTTTDHEALHRQPGHERLEDS